MRCALGALDKEERNSIADFTQDSTVDPLTVFCLVTRLRVSTVKKWLDPECPQYQSEFHDAYEMAVLIDGKDKLDRMFNGTKYECTLRDIDPKKFSTYMWYAHKIKVMEPQAEKTQASLTSDALKLFTELRNKMTEK